MRRIGAWLVCVAAAGSVWAQAPEKCTIEGRAVNALTGAPLKKTIVWVEPFSPSRGENREPTVTGPSTVTDAQGRFHLAEIDPGSYFLSARRTGYLNQGYGAEEPDVVGPPVKLAAGDHLGDVTLKLIPQALLYGKVTDEDGEAMPDAEVTVWRMNYAGGRKHLERFTAGTTQADGSAVIGGLAPGRYYLSAAVHGGEADTGPRDVYVPTYHPNSIDPAAAAPIEVAAGAEVRGLDIRLRKARTFRIRGRATPNVTLRLTDQASPTIRDANTGRDGRFEFSGVLPGRYMIALDDMTTFVAALADSWDGGPPDAVKLTQAVRPVIVEVTDSDLDDVVLSPSELPQIGGTVIGGTAGRRPTINLVPVSSARPPVGDVQANANGSFQFRRVLPDMYQVSVSQLMDDSYVKTVRFAGRDITNQDLDLTSGAGGALEITLAADGGEIAGTARGADGKALPGALVQVWPAGGDNARSLKADENGAFRFRGLPPADYRVIAWEALDDDLAEYPPFRARFEAQAAEVKVSEQSRESVDVTAVARAASTAEAAKLR